MQVNSKTFVVDLLIQEISLACSLKLIGIKFTITSDASCFLAVLCNYISH